MPDPAVARLGQHAHRALPPLQGRLVSLPKKQKRCLLWWHNATWRPESSERNTKNEKTNEATTDTLPSTYKKNKNNKKTNKKEEERQEEDEP